MATAESAEFVALDWSEPLDVDALLSATPPEATIRGMLFQFLDLAAEKAGKQQASKGGFIAFKNSPLREYMKAAVATAELAFPGEPLRQGLRQIGHVVYPSYAETMIGSAIFSVAGRDFFKIASLAARAYGLTIKPGSLSVSKIDERHVEVSLRQIWDFVDSQHVGIWEGALQVCNAEGQIRVRRLSPCDADFDIQWE